MLLTTFTGQNTQVLLMKPSKRVMQYTILCKTKTRTFHVLQSNRMKLNNFTSNFLLILKLLLERIVLFYHHSVSK